MSNFNTDSFITDLSSGTKRSGREKLFELNMDKVQKNQTDILRLPPQARVLIKGLLIAKPDLPFTTSEIAEFGATAGLETKQEPIQIVRFYIKQLKTLVIDEVKVKS